jgi:hypothetical protein
VRVAGAQRAVHHHRAVVHHARGVEALEQHCVHLARVAQHQQVAPQLQVLLQPQRVLLLLRLRRLRALRRELERLACAAAALPLLLACGALLLARLLPVRRLALLAPHRGAQQHLQRAARPAVPRPHLHQVWRRRRRRQQQQWLC